MRMETPKCELICRTLKRVRGRQKRVIFQQNTERSLTKIGKFTELSRNCVGCSSNSRKIGEMSDITYMILNVDYLVL